MSCTSFGFLRARCSQNGALLPPTPLSMAMAYAVCWAQICWLYYGHTASGSPHKSLLKCLLPWTWPCMVWNLIAYSGLMSAPCTMSFMQCAECRWLCPSHLFCNWAHDKCKYTASWPAQPGIDYVVYSTTAHIPSRLEPAGVHRSDGKWPDGITTWQRARQAPSLGCMPLVQTYVCSLART